MKKLIITCALVSLGSMVSFAQGTHAPQTSGAATPARSQAPTVAQLAEQRAKQYQKDLGLNEQQYKDIYQVEVDIITQDQAMRANGNQPGEGQAMQLQMWKDQRFQAAMTPDQYAKYDKMRTPPAPTKH